MKNKRLMSRGIIIVVLLSLLSACGSAPSSQNTVIDEKSSITLHGAQLIGLTIELSNGFQHTIVKNDIAKDVTRLPSIKRKPSENFQTVTFNVSAGEVNAKVMSGSTLVASKTFFISKGATYQWKIH